MVTRSKGLDCIGKIPKVHDLISKTIKTAGEGRIARMLGYVRALHNLSPLREECTQQRRAGFFLYTSVNFWDMSAGALSKNLWAVINAAPLGIKCSEIQPT